MSPGRASRRRAHGPWPAWRRPRGAALAVGWPRTGGRSRWPTGSSWAWATPRSSTRPHHPVWRGQRARCCPGVFCTRVAGVSFHDDVVAAAPLLGRAAGVEIRPEPANAHDRNPLAIVGGGVRVGYVPAPIADAMAPSGTRVGRGIILMEWSSNG